VIEALQASRGNNFLNLPVCGEDDTISGLVGVMNLI